MSEHVRNSLEAILENEGLVLGYCSTFDINNIQANGPLITSILRRDEPLDMVAQPIRFWRKDGNAVVEVNLNFVELSKPQRDIALLFIYTCLSSKETPERISWDFDTRIPPDKLEGIVTFTPHRQISSVLSS